PRRAESTTVTVKEFKSCGYAGTLATMLRRPSIRSFPMPKCCRALLAFSLSMLLISPGALAFSSPLSDEAIREAYFLGQRRDEKMTAFLEKYKQHLREPDRGPYVSSVEFLTPFALAVL